MGIIYFGTLDNAFCFYIGCPDWHHEVFVLPTKRRVTRFLRSCLPMLQPSRHSNLLDSTTPQPSSEHVQLTCCHAKRGHAEPVGQ